MSSEKLNDPEFEGVDYKENPDEYFKLLNKLKNNSIKVQFQEEEEEKKLYSLLQVSEKLNIDRENKVLTRWQERQKEWEKIETLIEKKLQSSTNKKLKSVSRPLMMTTTDEYRAKLEEYDLIQAAMPLKDKFSDTAWQMTLRDGGPIRVAIGHIFSGLECEIDTSSRKPKMVRKPKPATAVLKNDTFVEPNDNYLKKLKKYEKSIKEIRPHTLTYSEANQSLVISSKNLFQWAHDSSQEFVRRMQEENAIYDDKLHVIIEEDSTYSERSSVGLKEKSVHSEGSHSAIHHPVIEFQSPTDIVFSTPLKKSQQKFISFTNTSNITVYYQWKSQIKQHNTNLGNIFDNKGEDHLPLWSRTISKNRRSFFCLKDIGEILPGETVKSIFNFESSSGPGMVQENWTLTFTPDDTQILINSKSSDQSPQSPSKNIGTVSMKFTGFSTTVDETAFRRDNLAHGFDIQSNSTIMRDILYECIRRVRTPLRHDELNSRKINLFSNINNYLLQTIFTNGNMSNNIYLTIDRFNLFQQSSLKNKQFFSQVVSRYEELWEKLTQLQREDFDTFQKISYSQSHFLISNELHTEILSQLFKEKHLDVFDEVTMMDIEPDWNYSVSNILNALQKLRPLILDIETFEVEITKVMNFILLTLAFAIFIVKYIS